LKKTRQFQKKGRPQSTHRIRDYAINYQVYLLTQVMSNGVTSLNTMMGLFGLGVHQGSHCKWMYIGNELGKVVLILKEMLNLSWLSYELF